MLTSAAPERVLPVSNWAKPSASSEPRPTYPAYTPMVAVAITCTAASPMPPMANGAASGSSIERNRSIGRMPRPSAAPSSAESSPAMAASVLRKIGGTPSTTIVARVGQKPSPSPSRMEMGSRMPNRA